MINAKLHRATDAVRLNEICNDPSIYPYIHETIVGALDVSQAVANPANVALVGEHGAIIFLATQPAIYDVHVVCLPSGRGAWMREATEQAAYWLFTNTDALEIIAGVPKGNLGVLALARVMRMDYEFTMAHGHIRDHEAVPAHIYTLTMQKWLRSDRFLGEKAKEFHRKIDLEMIKLGSHCLANRDDAYDRNLAAFIAMVQCGQFFKAATFYNRFAQMAGFSPIKIISTRPLAVDVGGMSLIIHEDRFFVASFSNGETQLARAS